MSVGAAGNGKTPPIWGGQEGKKKTSEKLVHVDDTHSFWHSDNWGAERLAHDCTTPSYRSSHLTGLRHRPWMWLQILQEKNILNADRVDWQPFLKSVFWGLKIAFILNMTWFKSNKKNTLTGIKKITIKGEQRLLITQQISVVILLRTQRLFFIQVKFER